MIHILSEYHAKRKDEKSEHAKDAPHGTDEENHHRQNCQHGQNTTPKGTHETHRHIDHETDQRPLHPIFNAGWSGAEASFPTDLKTWGSHHRNRFLFRIFPITAG